MNKEGSKRFWLIFRVVAVIVLIGCIVTMACVTGDFLMTAMVAAGASAMKAVDISQQQLWLHDDEECDEY